MTGQNMQFHSCNKYIATAPLVRQRAVETKVIAGMEVTNDKLTLVPLTVVFASVGYGAGDVIYVDGGAASIDQVAKKVYEVDGVAFILVPDTFVLLAKVQIQKPFNFQTTLAYNSSNPDLNTVLVSGEGS